MKPRHIIKRFTQLLATRAHYKFIIRDWASLKDLGALSRALGSKAFTKNLEPLLMERPIALKALVVAPHPDDDIFSSGGTILRMVEGGCKVRVVYLTSPLSNEMEGEARAVSEEAGTEMEWWGYPARGIPANAESAGRLKKACVDFRPDVVFLPFLADDHDDHRQAARLFYEAFKGEGELNFEVWAYQVYSTVLPNVVIDITDKMDEKTKLIDMWRTRRASRDWAHYIRGLNALNSRFLKTNEARYAETFFVVPAREYVDLCEIYFVEKWDTPRNLL